MAQVLAAGEVTNPAVTTLGYTVLYPPLWPLRCFNLTPTKIIPLESD